MRLKVLLSAMMLCAGTAQAQGINYTWPYVDKDIQAQIGKAPVVIEHFTTQACLFCPAADQFFHDLVTKVPNIIGLACHVDYFDLKQQALAHKQCNERQDFYASHIDGGMNYTPQMVINGKIDVVGYKTDQVMERLIDAHENSIQLLSLSREGDALTITPPAITLRHKKADVWVATVRALVEVADKKRATTPRVYTNVVESMTRVAQWDGSANPILITPQVGETADKLVVLIQDDDGIYAAGSLDWIK